MTEPTKAIFLSRVLYNIFIKINLKYYKNKLKESKSLRLKIKASNNTLNTKKILGYCRSIKIYIGDG